MSLPTKVARTIHTPPAHTAAHTATRPARESVREPGPAVVELKNAELAFGDRVLWRDLNLTIHQGEYFAVLGSNGTGKTSFLKVLLGLLQLSAGTVTVSGTRPRAASRKIGYVPQQRGFSPRTPMRARDLVAQGVDGHRWGIRLNRRAVNERVDELLAQVGASEYAEAPVGLLSGGEQQRLRVAQALATDPSLLLCDEALLSLDLNHQYIVSELVNQQRETADSAVVFVTHDINPIIDHVDRILYLADGAFTIGTPDQVMRSEVLSQLYGAEIDVLRSNGRIIVTGRPDNTHHITSQEGLIP